MASERHITWQNFRENYIKPDDPASHIVEGSPRCEVFVESQGKRIGLRIAIKEPIQNIELPYQHINTNLVHSEEGLCAEVSCEIQSLFESNGDKTDFTFNIIHPTQAYKIQQEKMGIMDGWGSVFDRLDALLSTLIK